MKKTILCYTGLVALIIGLIVFAANAGGWGYGPHHLNWKTIGLPAVLVVGGLIFFVLNLDNKD